MTAADLRWLLSFAMRSVGADEHAQECADHRLKQNVIVSIGAGPVFRGRNDGSMHTRPALECPAWQLMQLACRAGLHATFCTTALSLCLPIASNLSASVLRKKQVLTFEVRDIM